MTTAAGTKANRMKSQRRGLLPRLGWGALGLLAFLALGEIVPRIGIVDEQYLPTTTRVLTAAANIIFDAGFLSDVASTLAAWGAAIGLACAIGIPAGIALAMSKIGFAASESVIAAVRPIPGVALIPLVILVWGNGLGAKVALAVFAIVWPILFNTMYGVRDVDPMAKEAARSYGISGARQLSQVILPSTAPFILTGIRVAASLAFIIVVGTELFAGTRDGIGAYILLQTTGGGDPANVMAGAMWAGVLGLLVNVVLAKVDTRFFRWARRGVETA